MIKNVPIDYYPTCPSSTANLISFSYNLFQLFKEVFYIDPKPLPDRAGLDNIVFETLGLTQEERKEVYRAVYQLVWNRISKARSV